MLVALVVTSSLLVSVWAGIRWQDRTATSLLATRADVWLSAERSGRIVLAAPRAERPGLAVQIGEQTSTTALDLVELDDVVAVHDRAAGVLVLVDRRTGAERTRLDAPRLDADAPGALISDSDSEGVMIVDRATGMAWRLAADGTVGPARAIPASTGDVVAGPGGVLWAVSDDASTAFRIDDEIEPLSIAGPFTDIGVVDGEVVIAGGGNVTFTASTTTRPIPGWQPGTPVIIADGTTPGCALVVLPGSLTCVGRSGAPSSVPTLVDSAAIDGAVARVIDDRVLLADRGSATVTIIDRRTGTATSHLRGEPSARTPRIDILPGGAVVDDPGSRFAITVLPDSTARVLDKLSRRTVVLALDGSISDDGLGTADMDADVETVLPGGTSEAAPDDGRNDRPQPAVDRAVTRSGRDVNILVLANDVDPDQDVLSIEAVTQPASGGGTAVVVERSSIRFSPPDISDIQTLDFTYRVTDPFGLTGEAAVTVEVIGDGSNTPPRLRDDTASTTDGGTVDVDVLGNDDDAEGDPLLVTRVDPGRNGTTSISGGGTIRYVPRPGFSGEESITYEAHDGYGGVSSAAVRITVEAVNMNRPPTARPDRFVVLADQPARLDVLANDDDADGDRLRLLSVSPVPGLRADLTRDGSLNVVASSEVIGLVQFGYVVVDETGLDATGTVTLFVEAPSPGPPIALDDRAVSASLPILVDVVANDVDPSGEQLVIEGVDSPLPTVGTASRVSPTVIQFSPAASFLGTVRFPYSVVNSSGRTASAMVIIDVIAPTDGGPIANDDLAVGYVDEVITIRPLANDQHPGGLPITMVGAPTLGRGTATVDAGGVMRFVPPNGEADEFVVGYTIQDPFRRTSAARVTFVVQKRPTTNSPPIAAPDLVETSFNTPVDVDVLANDVDADGDALQVTGFTPPSWGRVERSDRGLRFVPTADQSGVASFTYDVADAVGGSATAQVTVNVAIRPTVAPLATDDLVALSTGETTAADPLANDRDPDSTAPLALQSLGTPTPPIPGLTVRRLPGGSALEITAGSSRGTSTLSYVVVDRDGRTAAGRITIVVNAPPNTAPTPRDDQASSLAAPLTVDVLANDSDPEGGTLTLVSLGPVSPAGAGTATISSNTVALLPARTFTGALTLDYTVSDPQGSTATGRLTVNITRCPALPSEGNKVTGTRFETPVVVPLLDDDTLPIGWKLEVGNTSNGSVRLDAQRAEATFTPAAGFSGTGGFSYTVTTSCADVVTRSVSVTVNQAPRAVDDAVSTARNVPVTVDVLANDSDPDDDGLSIEWVGDAVGGTPTLSGQSITFTPQRDRVGPASFRYRIKDRGGLVATADVAVTIGNETPVARDDRASVPTGTPTIVVDVLANDDDPDGDQLRVIAASLESGSGVQSVTHDGQRVTISVDASQEPGTRAVISYLVDDGDQQARARLTVEFSNRSPVAVADDDTLDLARDSSSLTDVLANDSDPDGRQDDLVLLSGSAPTGTVTIEGRRIRFVPAPGQLGTVVIVYQIADAFGGRASNVLTIVVVDSTPPPPTDPPPTDPPPTDPPPTTLPGDQP